MTLRADRRERLDMFLARSVEGMSRSQVARWIAAGAVQVEGKPAGRAGQPLKPGMVVDVTPPVQEPHSLEPVEIPLDIVLEDDRLLVVNKPRGLVVHPASSYTGPTLVHALLARGGGLSQGSAAYRPGIVHRLDRHTTGLIVVAKDEPCHRSLAGQFSRREAGRVYAAIGHGTPRWEEQTVELPIGRDPRNRQRMAVVQGGKEARTRLAALRKAAGGTLILARLDTGRTHQVRVHLAALGHGVRGDLVYSTGEWAQGPLQLHAGLLRFVHPTDSRPVTVYAPPPGDFLAQLAREEVEQWN
ncbi:MAG: RluA family pseudouridine synthase [Fimbriimonadaceae bacterium]|nr:RluA family pseudouridine synthase [Fimbriimonadaceae bacterium]